MEGAAVAFVCSLYKVPVMLVKAVTNLRDVTIAQPDEGTDSQIDDFQENLKRASLSLRETLVKIINLC
jgi:nucleoside phosphorylase